MNAQTPTVEERHMLLSLLSAEERDDALIARLLSIPLPHSDAEHLVHWLKQQADTYWYRDPHRTFDYGDMIVQIGAARGDARQMALGMMTQGDALRMLNRAAEAWSKLEQAGELFLSVQDTFGWARTRIGRLGLSTELGAVEAALRDAEQAREIFAAHDDREMLLRLDLNTAVVYDLIGAHAQALERYQLALDAAILLGEKGERYLAILYTNMGYACNFLGDFNSALNYYNKAKTQMLARSEMGGVINIDLALAYIALGQGRYQHALSLLHEVIERAGAQFPKETALARREMVECYLPLNQFQKARDLALEVVEDYERAGASHDRGRTLLLLAEAEARLNRFDAASAALDEAERIFALLGAKPWEATAVLRRGQLALLQGNLNRAMEDACYAAQTFEAAQRPVYQAEALLLQAQTELAKADPASCMTTARQALSLVRRRVPPLNYSANLLLGQAAETMGDLHTARRRYQRAVAEVERAQQQLTITFRSGFVENRADALHALIGLHLNQGHTADAFGALERAKSLTLLSYLNRRDDLRWRSDDIRVRKLVAELAELRAEHHWYYRIANAYMDDQMPLMETEEAQRRLSDCERRIRTITEKLYLLSANPSDTLSITVPALAEMQAALPPDSALIEYYADGRDLYVFVLNHDGLSVYPLPTTDITSLIERLQLNVNRTLRLDRDSEAQQLQLANYFDRIASALYEALLSPIAAMIENCERLYIVPYGALHYLPFHLLRTAGRYLIEMCEVVTLPSAALLTRRTAPRQSEALILTHNWNGRLPQTQVEASIVSRYFPSTAYHDSEATREMLARKPGKLLHIAAHGAFRMDEPDFSFLQLAGEPLFMDDLLQYDMSYELVTLSACETGRARVAPGDELIGLGQGFLYGGASSLIASLWRIDDGITLSLMEHLYRELRAGRSKAGALRSAQCAASEGQQHPAFWGAFALIGNPDALSRWDSFDEGQGNVTT